MNTPVLPNISVISHCVARRQSSRGRDRSQVFRGVGIDFNAFDDAKRFSRPRPPVSAPTEGAMRSDRTKEGDVTYSIVLVEKIRSEIAAYLGDDHDRRQVITLAHRKAEETAQSLARESGNLTYRQASENSIYLALEFTAEIWKQLKITPFERLVARIRQLFEKIGRTEEAEERAILLDRLAKLQALSKLLRLFDGATRPSPTRACIPPPLDTSQVEAGGGKNAIHIPLN